MNPRVVGSILGILIGMGLIIYLDKSKVPSREPTTEDVASRAPAPLSQEDSTAVLRSLAAQQAEEIARLQRAREADEALELLRTPHTPRDPDRPELAQLRALSNRELRNEIETAVEEAANYTMAGAYAPERHKDLYQRINKLWDLTGLENRQNNWLGEAVEELNELAVQHAEEAMESGDEDEVIRVAIGLGDWAYRLNDDQEKRLIVAVEMIAKRRREEAKGA